MAQDFAKQRQAPPTAQRKATRVPPRPAKRSPWGWYFSGVFSGAVLMVFAYYGFARYQTLMQESPTAEAIAEEQELPTFDFGFYNELATAEVNVNIPPPADTVASRTIAAPNGSAPPSAPAAEAANVSYLLQAGSFQDKQDAETRRAKIILLNMDAQISAGVVAGRTWYRVQVGPFPSRGGAEAARNTLSASNIDSIPLLMR